LPLILKTNNNFNFSIMKKIFLLLFIFIATFSVAQKGNSVDVKPKGIIQVVEKNKKSAFKTRIIWNNNVQCNSKTIFSAYIPKGFTCFGFGWKLAKNIKSIDIKINYRVKIEDKWSSYKLIPGDISPKETPTNMYWTDLEFTPNQNSAHLIEFEIIGIENFYLDTFMLDMYYIEQDVELLNNRMKGIKASCPYRPYVIPRSVWLDPYYTQPPYTSTIINPTHCVIHYGASPDTYNDGAAIVRSYWNYHVNTNGWSDIGYNYLIDKFGNLYQGRQNTSPTTQDVQGAHAGASNAYSIGFNFLGNTDVTLPTTIQLDTAKQFLAWWFNWRGFDPTSSALLQLQSGGSAVVPRILGHKDTNIGGTDCPGTVLYSKLGEIRTDTKNIISACSFTSPTNLTVGTPSCPNNSVTFSWQNSGTGWYILLSNSSSYTNPYIKWVSGLTSYTGPAGFVLQADGTTPLTFLPSTTYYWKIWDGSTFTSGPSFTTLNCDNINPTTAISTPVNWKTQDFTATFSDSDNVNVEKAFYQVLDFDGQYWSANPNRGFFGDNFDILQPHWHVFSGTWNVTNGELIQSDETQNNTNIYAALTQTLSNRYLYHFIAKLGGSETNKRFGFHLFCDDANYTNRHNSYFVWFRIDDQTLEFYKVVNDSFTQELVIPNVTTNLNQSYDFKITYDRILGKIAVWRDNIYMGSWTDTSPYSSNGNYISFRTGNCTMNITELKVYRSRYPTVTVTLGDNTKDIRYQNPNPATSSAKIKSIVVDGNYNLSSIVYHDLNVDWTPPILSTVNDGSSSDIDTVFDNTTVSVNWQAGVDAHSDIQEYFYALGTTAGSDDAVAWTSSGTNTAVTLSNLNLTFGNKYYFCVKAVNHAGLTCNPISSDGFIVSSLNLPVADFYAVEDTIYISNPTALFVNQSQHAVSYLWDFGDGGTSTQVNPWHTYAQTGIYPIQLVAMNPPFPNDTLLKNNYLYVLDNNFIIPNPYVHQIYPNPFIDNIHIVFVRPFTGTIELTDMLGRTIMNTAFENVSQANCRIWQPLEKGAYIIKIKNVQGEVITSSILIK